MSTTTQAIRDALALGKKMSNGGTAFNQDGWDALEEACDPAALTVLLAELDAARAGLEAAVLAERERCANVCGAIAAEDGIGNYQHDDDYAVGAVSALISAAIEIREGAKS